MPARIEQLVEVVRATDRGCTFADHRSVPQRPVVVGVTLELALRCGCVAFERELADDRRRDEWGGAGEQPATSEFRHD
ncbi:MAG: hypothetical protein M3Q53_03650 [Actinomycetota bacterium]|nr:hypothetical protein [Actinomycetota bacterium]